ncbi:GerA spore germination protein [Solibacillus isronensis B3W22]|uniref:GerA spore germination protein n=1 Tax=Solibacillus isronensis B3W22 TaxID=1224748 RepID=K1LPY5_9BACL|nr:spore germination protein [Solibacillus isronensis]AMO85615.1 spore gernimation protein GerA [Solibacillus silvestris]EKB46259.1 GerA spore germination protein [Solibacillus isronensis B3W22]
MSSEENIKWINEQFKDTNELTMKTLEDDDKKAELFYIKPLINVELLQQIIIKPFFEMQSETKFIRYLKALPQFQDSKSQEQLKTEVLNGNVVLFIQNKFYLLDLKFSFNDQTNAASVETTIHGSQLALSDNIATNINIIRSDYHQPTLYVEYATIGQVNNHKMAIIYDKEKVNKNALKLITEKLQQVDKQVITSTVQLSNYINNKKLSLFPQLIMTERPDRIVYNLAGGKVIILVDGNPQALIAPVYFFDFMTSMEDNYHSFYISFFLKFLRYTGLFISLLLPGLYIGITSFAPEVFRTELALTIAGSRIGVPFSSFVEVLFMLFFMEMLLEASIRLPKSISATATTVGGLILGTAVTEASLASDIMVIIVSAVAISTFVIPINEMAFSIRVIRFIFILAATLLGLAGLTLALYAMIMYLVSIDSFGEPYLKFNEKKTSKTKAGEEI